MTKTQENFIGTSKEEAAKLATLQRANRAESTLKQYSREIRRFEAWCRATSRCPVPAEPRTVATFIATEAFRMQSSTTLDSISAAINCLHQVRGVPSPTGDSFVREIINGSKKKFAKPVKQRRGMTKDLLQRLLQHWLGPQVNQGSRFQWRSAVLETLLFVGMARGDDLRRLERDQIEFTADGMTLHCDRRKNDPWGKGHLVTVLLDPDSRFCPVRMTREYLRQVPGQPDDWAFPKLRKVRKQEHYVILGQAVPYHDCKNAQAIALKAIGVNPKGFGTHSGRIGAAQEYYDAGFKESDIGRRGGWATGSKMPGHYSRQASSYGQDMAKAIRISKKN